MKLDLTPQKLTYGLMGALLLILLGIGFIYFQLNNKVQNDIAMLQEEKINQEIAAERIDQLKSLKHRLNEIEEIRADIDKILPSDKKQDKIIGQLASLAQESGFNISSLSFESTGGLPSELSQTVAAGIPGLRVAPVKFAITKQRYTPMMSFLRDIENLQRFTQVESLSITTTSDDNNQDLLNFNMTLHIYMQADNPESSDKSGSKGGNTNG